MRISYRHKFIFIHVDRTGGTSISRALDPFSYHQSDLERLWAAGLRRIGIARHYYKWHRFTTQHVTAMQLKEVYPQKVFDNYFKFGFVRNPWDWLVSIYHARLQHPVHSEYELARYLGSFPKYLHWWADNRKIQQAEYLYDDQDNLLVDFVGRHERLSDDFEFACKKIGIKAQLDHLNAAIHRKEPKYREYYSAEDQRIVETICERDISLLGYEF